ALSCGGAFLLRRGGGRLSVDRRRLMRAFVGGWNFGGAGGKIRYPRHAAPRQAVSIEMPPVLLVAGPGRGMESSALASRSSSVAGRNASTPIRPAHATNQAEIANPQLA